MVDVLGLIRLGWHHIDIGIESGSSASGGKRALARMSVLATGAGCACGAFSCWSAGQLSGKESPQSWALLDWRSLAFLLQCLSGNQTIVLVRQDCQAAVFARDFRAQLPQKVCVMADGLTCVGLVNARAGNEVRKGWLLRPLEDGAATMLTLEVSGGLDEVVLRQVGWPVGFG